MKVVQIKGSNGSGKSTIPLQMVAASCDIEVEQWNTVLHDFGWVLVGHYDLSTRTSNGCDSIRTVSDVKLAIMDAIDNHPDFNILFEGMMISTIKSTFYNFLLELEVSHNIKPMFVILNASVEGCLERIADRKSSRPRGINVDNITHKCESIVRHAESYNQTYVRWIDVDSVARDDMLYEFLSAVDNLESYMDVVRLSNREVKVWAAVVGIEYENNVRARNELAALVPDIEITSRSEILEPSEWGPWADVSDKVGSDITNCRVYDWNVGYKTSTGNILSLLVHMHVLKRGDVPLLTEWEQATACGTCKGMNGGCPGCAPRFDAIRPSLDTLAIITVSVDMAWAIEYSGNRNTYMRGSCTDSITSWYVMRLLKHFDNRYVIGLGNCPVCVHRTGGCDVIKGLPCRYPKQRIYSMEAVGVDCDMLNSILYGEWLPWFYYHRGINDIPRYMIRYAGVLMDKYSALVWDVMNATTKADLSYVPMWEVPDLPKYKLGMTKVPTGPHKGCNQYVYVDNGVKID